MARSDLADSERAGRLRTSMSRPEKTPNADRFIIRCLLTYWIPTLQPALEHAPALCSKYVLNLCPYGHVSIYVHDSMDTYDLLIAAVVPMGVLLKPPIYSEHVVLLPRLRRGMSKNQRAKHPFFSSAATHKGARRQICTTTG